MKLGRETIGSYEYAFRHPASTHPESKYDNAHRAAAIAQAWPVTHNSLQEISEPDVPLNQALEHLARAYAAFEREARQT